MLKRFGRALAAVAACSVLGLCVANGVDAKPLSGRAAELAELSLEELLQVEVFSAAKKKQKLSESAAAVYVLTAEDIRRSGVTSVPEALRLVPGVEVARIDSNKWAITIRGFNERFANKLLVLIDGRSVYTPLFAGVYWDIQDVVLEDVERIEVVRGPGGALWGANAVNGVINILTKHAQDTQGLLLSGGAGTEEEAFATARWGTKIADDAYLRVFGKYFARDDFESTRPGNEGDDASDEWHLTHGGFRMDWDPSESDAFTLQGDLYEGEAGSFSTASAPPPDFETSGSYHPEVVGGNVLGRWTHTTREGQEMRLQAYYDRTDRDAKPPTTNENRNTADIDFQHRFRIAGRHDVVWGLGYRVTWDEIGNSFATSFAPDERTLHLFSGFVQDEIGFLDDTVRLTVGTKLEHNDFTGVEVQPNARLLFLPHDRHTLWFAASRAVRTPSRAEDDVVANGSVLPAGFPGSPCETSPFPCVFSLRGDSAFDAEKLLAYELGYRVQLSDDAGLDLTGFYNDYDDLRTAAPDAAGPFVDPGPPAVLVIPFTAGNEMEGETWGFEVAGDWQPLDAWKLRSGYTFLEMDLAMREGVPPDLGLTADGSSPQNQVFLRSMLDLPYDFELDANLKWVDELKALDIGSYAGLDVRLGWRPLEGLELSLVGQNLLEHSNQEFASSLFVSDEPTKVERGVYGKVTWRY